MTFLQSILLGLIQGVAEFLPISSSGHLAIAQNLLNINAEVPAFYDVLLHLGTLVAVFVAYWQDICDMVREFFCGIGDLVHHSTPTPVPPARRLILLIILGTLPLFAILPIKDTVEGLKSSMVFIGAALIVTGFLLFFSDRARKGRKDASSATRACPKWWATPWWAPQPVWPVSAERCGHCRASGSFCWNWASPLCCSNAAGAFRCAGFATTPWCWCRALPNRR